MKKRELRARIAELEQQLIQERTKPITFDNLSVCWSKRTITFRRQTIEIPEDASYDCVTFPITNDLHLLSAGSFRVIA